MTKNKYDWYRPDLLPKITKKQLWHILFTLPIKLYIKDIHREFTFMNKATLEAHGFRSLDEAWNKTDADLFTEEHSGQTEIEEQRILAKGDPLIDVNECETWKDGRRTYVLTSKMALRKGKKIVGIFGISKDTTELHKSKELMESLLDKLPQCVFVKDKDCNFEWCNKSFVKWHEQYLGKHDIIGKNDYYLWSDHPELADGFVKDDHRVMEKRMPIGPITEKHIFPDGKERILETYKFPRFDKEENTIGLIGIYSDITERTKEDQIAQEIGRVVGHSLNTWMGTLQANCDLLIDDIGSNPELERLKGSIDMLKHVGELATGLATLGPKLEFKKIDIRKLVKEQVNLTGEHRIQIQDPSPSMVIEVSEYHLRLAITELLTNAIIHGLSKAKDGWIKIWWEPKESLCEIHVRDNGGGIKQWLRGNEMFKPRTTTEGSTHTGLGLNYVKRVADYHNGTSAEISSHNEGAHFVIQIPIRQYKES